MAQVHPQRLVAGLVATRRSMGDGTIRGRARLATPYRRVAPTVQDVVDMTDPAWPAEPCDCCPDPWVWYRGDDLTGYVDGQNITVWPDRTGGGRDMDDHFGGPTPKYLGSAIGGHPGVQPDGATTGQASHQAGATTPVDIGWTISAVVSNLGGPADEFEWAMQGVNNELSMAVWPGGEINLATFDAVVNLTYDFSVPRHLLGRHDVTGISMWVDGVQVGSAPAANGNDAITLFMLNYNTTRVTELKSWTEPLSDGCIAAEWAYSQARYGL